MRLIFKMFHTCLAFQQVIKLWASYHLYDKIYYFLKIVDANKWNLLVKMVMKINAEEYFCVRASSVTAYILETHGHLTNFQYLWHIQTKEGVQWQRHTKAQLLAWSSGIMLHLGLHLYLTKSTCLF